MKAAGFPVTQVTVSLLQPRGPQAKYKLVVVTMFHKQITRNGMHISDISSKGNVNLLHAQFVIYNELIGPIAIELQAL